MHLFVTPFWLPKAGSSETEFEDAFYPKDSIECRGELLRFAVADGATEGVSSDDWAKLLVNTYCKSPSGNSSIERLVTIASRRWRGWRARYTSSSERRGEQLPWFVENGLQRGAFATILGITFMDSTDERMRCWSAVAVGDSCLFQVRAENLVAAFPISDAVHFGTRPGLLCSNLSGDDHLEKVAAAVTGQWLSDDRFYLMTDALALWFLRQYEAGKHPWRILRDFGTRDQTKEFATWIDEQRSVGDIRNDDITMVRIDVA